MFVFFGPCIHSEGRAFTHFPNLETVACLLPALHQKSISGGYSKTGQVDEAAKVLQRHQLDPTRGLLDFTDVKTFHPSLSHPGWPALRCPWMWSVGQVFSEPVQSPNVGMWRCAQLSESRRLMRIRRRLVKKIIEPL